VKGNTVTKVLNKRDGLNKLNKIEILKIICLTLNKEKARSVDKFLLKLVIDYS
jgi:hypothetical protein